MNTEIQLGKYRHFKGNEYEVIGIANHSETMEEMVVYRALYGEGGLWVRPASMWNETVERDGQVYKRFTYIGKEESDEKNRNSMETAIHAIEDNVKIDSETSVVPKVKLSVVLEAYEEATNAWTYFYDLDNHENIYIFESGFMDDEDERDLIATEPERFVALPKKEEIYQDDRVKKALAEASCLDDIFKELAMEWCVENGLAFE